MNKYDVIVLGGGPGGYVAAIKSAQLGAKVLLIEAHKIGGICLNYGCIPTKTMLRTANLFRDIKNADVYGIEIGCEDEIRVNWTKLQERKEAVVKKLTGGVKQLLKHNGVEVVNGYGEVISKNTVRVDDTAYNCESLILATGASSRIPEIPGLKEAFEKNQAIDSTGAVNLDHLPKSVLILGGGVTAVEFATLFNSLGTQVTLLNRSDKILKFLDDDLQRTMQDHLEQEGVRIIQSTRILKVEGTTVHYADSGQGVVGGHHKVSGDRILVSLGRDPNITAFESLKLKMSDRGVEVDGQMQTSVSGVYAIGDLTGKFMLAHVASAEAIVASEAISGKESQIDYRKVPSCIYSFPEVGTVGYTERDAREAGYDVDTSVFPLSANGKALAEGDQTGYVKIVLDKTYGEVLGVHIIASHATDMIAEAAASLELEATVHDLAKTVHPHPTLSEVVMEAAHGAVSAPIHGIGAKKSPPQR